MGAAGFAAIVGKTRPPAAGCLPEDRGSTARTLGWRGASPIRAAALSQIIQGFVSQRIESTGSDIFLNLAVPSGSVQLGEPRPKCGEFLRGKPANSILDLFKRAHKTKFTPPDKSAQPGVFLTADETRVNFNLDRLEPTCYKITVRLRQPSRRAEDQTYE
jgi:hypothetical protein